MFVEELIYLLVSIHQIFLGMQFIVISNSSKNIEGIV